MGEAPTCDESDTEADEEENLQHEVAIVVNYHSRNYGYNSQTKVLDGLHAVEEGRGEGGGGCEREGARACSRILAGM